MQSNVVESRIIVDNLKALDVDAETLSKILSTVAAVLKLVARFTDNDTDDAIANLIEVLATDDKVLEALVNVIKSI